MTGGKRAPRLLIVDTAVADDALSELKAFESMGYRLTVNIRRVAGEAVRDKIAARCETADFDGFDEQALVDTFEAGQAGYDALKCRAGIPLTRRVLLARPAVTLTVGSA